MGIQMSDTTHHLLHLKKEAFLHAVSECRPFLIRLAKLQLTSSAEAEDVVQDTIVAAISKWDSFREQSTLRSWLVGILKFKIIDQIRHRTRQGDYKSIHMLDDENDLTEHLFSHDGSWNLENFISTSCPEGEAMQTQLLELVELCLTHLSDTHARIFLMREYLGMEFEDILKTLAISNGNLRIQLYRSRMRLRECVVRGWGEVYES